MTSTTPIPDDDVDDDDDDDVVDDYDDDDDDGDNDDDNDDDDDDDDNNTPPPHLPSSSAPSLHEFPTQTRLVREVLHPHQQCRQRGLARDTWRARRRWSQRWGRVERGFGW